MKCSEIISFLERLAPPACAESWDNPGLLAGDREKEIQRVFVALDATDKVIEEACQAGADMLITHHPLIFSGLRSVNEDDFIGRRVRRLIREDICCYAIHTNFDIAGDMAGLLTARLPFLETEILDVTGEGQGLGRIGKLKEPLCVKRLIEIVKDRLEIPNVVLYGDASRTVRTVAVMPGSGKSEIKTAVSRGAELMLTGDIGHHEGIDALAQGMMIVDAGHYGMEKVFTEYIRHMLEREYKDLAVTAEKPVQPFMIL